MTGGRLTAKSQPVQRYRTRDYRGDHADEPARGVTGNVIVARMGNQIVGDNVDRRVRYEGRESGRGDHQRDERT